MRPSLSTSPVAAIILAAGGSRRLSRPKQLLPWGNKTLLEQAVDMTLASCLRPVIVVLGYQADVLTTILGARPVQVVVNPHWEEGQSTSLRTGLAALPDDVIAAVFLPVDQPGLTTAVLDELVNRFRATGASIVAAGRAGRPCPPVLFARSRFPELNQITGDQGGRELLARYQAQVEIVEVALAATLDVDTEEEYHLAKALLQPKNSTRLRTITHLIIDMDGVLYRDDEPMPGLSDFFAFLRAHSIGFILATNNATRTPEQYVQKMADLGVQVTAEEVITSALATAAWLASQAPVGTPVYAIGEDGIREALLVYGFTLTNHQARYVVVGLDRRLDFEKLTTAALLIRAGAGFIGTNPDPTLPTPAGLIPGNGAILAALKTATGVEPIIVGKPQPHLFQQALVRLGARPETTAVLGDRLDTDILGGQRAGLTTILVLTGATTPAELLASAIQPDLIYPDLVALRQAWETQLDFPPRSQAV